MKKVSKRALESLIKSGAMDGFGTTRKALFQAIDKVVSKSQKKNKEKNQGQLSLLSIVQDKEDTESPACTENGGIGIQLDEPCQEEWLEQEKLRYEQDVLGFFLSGHPLQSHREKLEFFEAREEPGFRVDTCRTCNMYIKTTDFRKMDRNGLPLVDDLESLPLDIRAQKENFKRATLSAWGF